MKKSIVTMIILVLSVVMLVVISTPISKGLFREIVETNTAIAIPAPAPVWPTLQYNIQHTGQCPYDASKNDGTLRWKYKVKTSRSMKLMNTMVKNISPAIGSDGTIYIETADGYLYAINSNGTLKWKYQVEGHMLLGTLSPTIIADGTIYIEAVSDTNNYLYAINSNGTLKWKYNIEYSRNTFPALITSDGIIYIESEDSNLYAINSNGGLKWKFETGGNISSPLAIAPDGTIYVSSRNKNSNNLYAINSDGTLKWERKKIGFNIYSFPVVASNGIIYAEGMDNHIGAGDHNLYAINPDGTLKWKVKIGGVSCSPAIASDGTIYTGGGLYLYAINPDGTLKWKVKIGYDISFPIISLNGTVYVASLDSLYAINPEGTLRWEYKTSSLLTKSSPVIDSSGIVYIFSGDTLYAIGNSRHYPARPSSPIIRSIGIGASQGINVSWEGSDQGSFPIGGYTIYRGITSGGESNVPIATVNSNTTHYEDTSNLKTGTKYYYYIKAFDNQSHPIYSLPSNEVYGTIGDTTPPNIFIFSPIDNSTVGTDTVILSGKVTDKESEIALPGCYDNTEPLNKIRCPTSGVKISISSDGSFSITVKLREGKNRITIEAYDAAGNEAKKAIMVTYKKPVQEIVITLQPDNPIMTVNGAKQEIDPGRGTKPVIIPKWGRTVVPIRAIVEALGGTIGWNGTERKVTINFNNTVVELWIDNPKARVNGEMKWIDSNNHGVKPIIVNGRTMLPLRFVAESLGCTVNWDPDTKTITITYQE